MSLSGYFEELESILKDAADLKPEIREQLKKIKLEIFDLEEQIQLLISAGVLISKDQEQGNVLNIIINTARALTNADGGTVYTLNEEFEDNPFNPGEVKSRFLKFQVLQNETMNVFLSGSQINLPPVPLELDGEINHKNVSAYCANTGLVVNIPDVYNAEGFDFSGAKKYDQTTGYRSKSMLVIPLKDHENQINGVLQLINRKTADGKEVVAFSDHDQAMIQSISFQASATLTTQKLLHDQVTLFNSFVQVLAEGLGEKSPYNFSHINRVAILTKTLAEGIDDWDEGIYGRIHFNQSQMEELSLAGWMHDIGKLTTPEHVVSKAIKLEIIQDQFDNIIEKFNSKIKDLEIEYLKKENELLKANAQKKGLKELEKEKKQKIDSLIADLKKLNQMNFGGEFISEEMEELVQSYHNKCIDQHIGTKKGIVAGNERTVDVMLLKEKKKQGLLSEQERDLLSIGKGTLSTEERKQINDHADRSWRWLMKLPFPKKMMKLPLYAGAHHETLDGTGYPNRLKADQLPIQSRIIAVADIFEALTANDRPYKQPMPLKKAFDILGFMVRDGHLDPEIILIFLKSGLYLKYAKESIDESQVEEIDIDEWILKYYPEDFQHDLPYYDQLTNKKSPQNLQ